MAHFQTNVIPEELRSLQWARQPRRGPPRRRRVRVSALKAQAQLNQPRRWGQVLR